MYMLISKGDYMSFEFNGSAIYIYGSKRDNHGAYQGMFGSRSMPEIHELMDMTVQLDTRDPVTMSGLGPEGGEFQTLLYGSNDFPATRPHRVTITNRPALTEGRPGVYLMPSTCNGYHELMSHYSRGRYSLMAGYRPHCLYCGSSLVSTSHWHIVKSKLD